MRIGAAVSGSFSKGPQWPRWGVDFENTRFQSAAAAGMTTADIPKLKLKWAFGLGQTNAARAQPSVAGGRLFIGSESGTVYSLDVRTACIDWAFQADGSVTAAPSIGDAAPLFRRSESQRLCARRCDREIAVESSPGRSFRRARYRRVVIAQRRNVRAACLFRRSDAALAVVRMLHVSAAASSRWMPRRENASGKRTPSRKRPSPPRSARPKRNCVDRPAHPSGRRRRLTRSGT